MPVLNDFGEAAYQRVTQQATDLANRLGIQPEIIIQFFNDTAHFPQTLDELNRWGDTPDKEYGFRRRQPNGVWTPIYQGVTPGKAENDPGFKHRITNEVGNIQRFQQVDPSGNVFGGSFDPAYNAAHPELAGQTGVQTALSGLPVQSGPTQRSASASPMDSSNYVAPRAGGFVSVVDGVPNQFPSQAEAENDYNTRTGGGAAPSGGAAPPVVAPAGGGGAPPSYPAPSGGYPTPGSTLTNPQVDSMLVTLMNNAAQLAYQQRRLELDRDISLRLDEREKQRLALDAATQAARQVQERAEATGTYPDGTPTLRARELAGTQTGYTGQGIGARAAAAFASQRAQNPTITGSGPEAAGIWQQMVPGLSLQAAQEMASRANQYFAQTGQQMPDDLIAQHLGQLGGPAAAASAMGTPTLAREQEQNRTAISAWQTLSTLRGPENAFAYANALSSLPESIRGQIGAMMSRLPVQAQNPAQAGFLDDLGAPQTQQTTGGGPTQVGRPALAFTGPPGALQPTQVGQPVLQRGPMEPTQTGQPVAQRAVLSATPTLRDAISAGARPPQAAPNLRDAISAGARPPQTGQTGEPTQVGRPVLQRGLMPPLSSLPVQTRPMGAQPQIIAPNQLSPTDMVKTPEYARQVLWAGYENGGMDKNDAIERYMRSLPVASGPRRGTYR